MVKPPHKVYSECYAKAQKYTENTIQSCMDRKFGITSKDAMDRTILATICNNDCCILEMNEFMETFADCGYGPAKAKKWLGNWEDLNKVKIYYYDSSHRIICFLKEPLSPIQKKIATEILSRPRQTELPVVSA